ncbi:MAG: VWA domain-containing protein [Proteobacteria bacterium]|nr:VWA domain-containing protein [Pseudomonadota bacterium]
MNTEIIAIVDRSGSMHSLKNDVDGAFDAFVEEQRRVPSAARLTLVQFDSEIENVYVAQPLAEVPAMDLRTRGSTALLDAIGTTLHTQGQRIKEEAWAELVIVVIATDGQENASREFNRDAIIKMVQHAEKNDWKFIYLASNQDAFQAARDIGSMAEYSTSHAASGPGTRESYSYASEMVHSLRSRRPRLHP